MRLKTKIYTVFLLTLSISVYLTSCRKKEVETSAVSLGTVTVDLSANENLIRKREALLGNMICDAIKKNLDDRGKIVDFVIVNSGNIRYNTSTRPDGIYKAGVYTSNMVQEMLPFGDASYIVKLTGKQLKEVLERSLALYPLAKGPFLQVSKELRIVVDTTKLPQLLDVNESSIVSQGSRIVSIKINDIEYDTLAVYSVGLPEFIAEGNDGYVTLKNLAPSQKENLGENVTNAVTDYIIINVTLTPLIEGRIQFQ